MKHIVFVLSILVAACSATSEHETNNPQAIVTPCEDSGAPDVQTETTPCELSVTTLNSVSVFVGQAHNTVITATGCFTGVADIQVETTSVPFKILDAHTAVFVAAREEIPSGSLPLPYTATVHFIQRPSIEVSTNLTFTAK